MNSAFRDKIIHAGIDFTRFLAGIAAAMVEANNPKYTKLIADSATVLDAHLATLQTVDSQPAAATAVATAEPDGGFPGAARPGSAEGAVNGHHVDTTTPEVADAPPNPIAPSNPTPAQAAAAATNPVTPIETRVAALESGIAKILALLTEAGAPTP